MQFSEAQQYYSDLFRFGMSLTHHETEADDLVQQTFLIFAKKRSQINDPDKVKSWLFTTLYREFLRGIRKRRVLTVWEPNTIESVSQGSPNRASQKIDFKRALQVLEHIAPNLREPIILYYIKELSYKAIATQLNIPIGTVMSRLARGKAELKSKMIQGAEAHLNPPHK
ncbi:MAG TPA: RNA polymerase sigma factor [Opitutales bacterium]|nr:RNA polymerase sigma factor [Opitutales bacterium]